MGWQVTEEGQNAFGHVSSSADGFGDIATTWGPDAAANARLIAAAPDLLSALERARDAIVAGSGTISALEQVRLAIARARGANNQEGV
jgi:hypothetical protein